MDAGCLKCEAYEKELIRIQEEFALMKFELEDLRGKRYKGRKKQSPEDEEKKPPRKKGGKFGHIGWFRKKPEKIDKIEDVNLTECPSCGSKDLKQYKETEDHIQEDIVIPEVETTLYRKKIYYCKICKEAVTGKGKNEMPRSYIGPKAKAWAIFLKYRIKVSDRDIKQIFKALGLTIVPSSIVGFRDQLKREAEDIYRQLIHALRTGKFVHGDETGTRLDGKPAWRWKFANKKISVTHTDTSRGQKVVEKILGKKYDGVLISDFLSAYNKILTKAKQRCLIHLLRDLKKVIAFYYQDTEVVNYCQRLKAILQEGIDLYKGYKDKKWDNKYETKRERIVSQLNDFHFPNPQKKILVRFAKRLMRHKKELFVFLYESGIDYHNNHAEQQIRPDVLHRKITFGNRSEKGAKVHDVAMSILQTAVLNGLDAVEIFKDILLTSKAEQLSNILPRSSPT